jgi:hypothetical protein
MKSPVMPPLARIWIATEWRANSAMQTPFREVQQKRLIGVGSHRRAKQGRSFPVRLENASFPIHQGDPRRLELHFAQTTQLKRTSARTTLMDYSDNNVRCVHRANMNYAYR